MPVQDLLRYDEIVRDDAPSRAHSYRIAFAYGFLAWSIPKCVLAFRDSHLTTPDALVMAGALIVLGASLTGLAMAAVVHLDYRRRFDRLARVLAYDPRIVPPPPDSATHRLPCGLVIDRNRVVTGSLYLVPNGLLFQSNIVAPAFLRAAFRRTRPAPFQLLFSPVQGITLDIRSVPRSRLERIVGSAEISVLIISLGENEAAFRVANTYASLQRLESVLAVACRETSSS